MEWLPLAHCWVSLVWSPGPWQVSPFKLTSLNVQNATLAADDTGVTAKRYGMKRMPGVYLLGRDSRLRSYKGTLEQAIKTELAAKPKPKKP